jgi:hypothetical protein
MARPRKRASNVHTKVRLWEFAGRGVPDLQDKLHAEGMREPPSKDDIASALVWMATQMPGAVVKAMIESYTKAEREALGLPQPPPLPDE